MSIERPLSAATVSMTRAMMSLGGAVVAAAPMVVPATAVGTDPNATATGVAAKPAHNALRVIFIFRMPSDRPTSA